MNFVLQAKNAVNKATAGCLQNFDVVCCGTWSTSERLQLCKWGQRTYFRSTTQKFNMVGGCMKDLKNVKIWGMGACLGQYGIWIWATLDCGRDSSPLSKLSDLTTPSGIHGYEICWLVMYFPVRGQKCIFHIKCPPHNKGPHLYFHLSICAKVRCHVCIKVYLDQLKVWSLIQQCT